MLKTISKNIAKVLNISETKKKMRKNVKKIKNGKSRGIQLPLTSHKSL